MLHKSICPCLEQEVSSFQLKISGEVALPASTDRIVSGICDAEFQHRTVIKQACLKSKARVEPLTPQLRKCSKPACAMM